MHNPPMRRRAWGTRDARSLIAFAWLLSLPLASAGQELKTAPIGDLTLESGEVLRDCRVGYRTYGRLDAQRSNAVAFPTWFAGRSDELADYIGPGRWIDDSRYFVVALDALADGVSSSPSNSPLQPRMRFPRISVADMVESQHRLLTRVLHLEHLRAVVGSSMGGMQTFQWLVSYPDFMDRAVAVVGSPRLAAYDLLLWRAQIDAIENAPEWKNGDYDQQPATAAVAALDSLALTSPGSFNREVTRDGLPGVLAQARKDVAEFDANDRLRQLQAMLAHDVSARFGGSMERAAAMVKARALVIVSRQDHMVTPGPALEFARLVRAGLIELQGDCGHLAAECESPSVVPVIAAFLADQPIQ